jgi:hypothetical protein
MLGRQNWMVGIVDVEKSIFVVGQRTVSEDSGLQNCCKAKNLKRSVPSQLAESRGCCGSVSLLFPLEKARRTRADVACRAGFDHAWKERQISF